MVRRGVGGLVYYKKEKNDCEDIMYKEAEDTHDLSLSSLFLLLIYVFVIVKGAGGDPD